MNCSWVAKLGASLALAGMIVAVWQAAVAVAAGRRGAEWIGGAAATIPGKANKPAAKPAKEKPPTPAEEAQQAIKNATDQLAMAREQTHAAKKDLDQVVHEIEEAQPSDSPFAQARQRFEAARKDYQQAVDQVLKSPEYKTALDAAGDATAIADLRSKTLSGDAKVSEAATALSAARKEYEAIRTTLLKDDSKWQAASDKLKEERKAETEATTALHDANLKMAAVNKDLKKKQLDAAIADAQAKQAKALAAQQKAATAAQQKAAAQQQKYRQEAARRGIYVP